MFSLKLKQTNDKIIMFVCLQIKVVSGEQEWNEIFRQV